MVNLSTKYAGLTLSNPIIVASSGLTETASNVKELAEAGAGAIVLKSIFEEEILMEMEQVNQQMVGKPYIFPETMDYMDEEPEDDLIRTYLKLIADCKKLVDIPIIASINCVSNQKWTYLAKEIEKAGADALELNIFSLASNMNQAAGEIEQMYVDIIKEVNSLVDIPISVKISPYFTALGQMTKKFVDAGASGIVMFNRFYSPDINTEDIKLSSSFVLSAPSDIAMPLRWIALLSGQLNCDIAATTGIFKGNDVLKMLLVGAGAVQIASTIYKQGPKVIAEMKSEISNWMVKNNYGSIAEFKGKLSLQKDSDLAAWERVQFMREFRHFVK